MKNSTGRRPSSSPGVQTFSVRQSSATGSGPIASVCCMCGFSAWTETGPNSNASRVPDHGSAACGGAKRSSPSGGCAYGTPRKTDSPSSSRPISSPDVTRTAAGATRGPFPCAASIEPADARYSPAAPPATSDKYRFRYRRCPRFDVSSSASQRCGYCQRRRGGKEFGIGLAAGWAAGASNPARPRTEGPLLLTIGTIRYHVNRFWRGQLLARSRQPPEPHGSWSAHGEGKT